MWPAPFLEYDKDSRTGLNHCFGDGITIPVNAWGVAGSLAVWNPQASYEMLFSPNQAASILGERKTGDWTTQTAFFPTIEHTGEVSSYGDYSESGSAGANTNFPQRQSYLYQTIVEYGELEMDRAGLAKIGWVSEQNGAAALAMNKYQNLTYFFGVASLQNYGLLDGPILAAGSLGSSSPLITLMSRMTTTGELFRQARVPPSGIAPGAPCLCA